MTSAQDHSFIVSEKKKKKTVRDSSISICWQIILNEVLMLEPLPCLVLVW